MGKVQRKVPAKPTNDTKEISISRLKKDSSVRFSERSGVDFTFYRLMQAYHPDPGLDHGVTGDTFGDMKRISIKQLHAETGRWVRVAKSETVTVTDHGEPIATLTPYTPGTGTRPVFTLRGRSPRPRLGIDSTAGISGERDRW